MAPGRSVVELTLDDLASCDDAARTAERSSSNAARGYAQLPSALPDALAVPVLAIQQEAGQPAQGEAPAATTSFRAAAGVSALSESDPRRATRCVARRVRSSWPNISAENVTASIKLTSQQADSLVAATLLHTEQLLAAPSPQLLSISAAADRAAEPPWREAERTPLGRGVNTLLTS